MDWKRIWKFLLRPPALIPLLLLPVCAAALTYAFSGGSVPAQTAACALSFYALAALCARLPGFLRFCREFSGRNKYVLLWRNDIRFRINTTLTVNVVWNSIYALAHFVLGIYHGSFWFFSLAGYYFSLAFIRFFLARHTARYLPGEDMRRELKLYRDCGWSFLAINLALSAMILLMVVENHSARHHEITVIAMAAYTFASFASAVVNSVRYRKYNSPVFSASKTISLAAVCVSTLTLERSMLASFRSEKMTPQLQRLFLALSGGGVSLFIIVTALFMILSAGKKLKLLETE